MLAALCQSAVSIANESSKPQPLVLELSDVQSAIQSFLERQTRSLPGKVRYSVGPIANPALVKQCQAFEVASSQGARSYGRTRVSVRCTEGARWNMLVPVEIKLQADYVITARPISGGQSIAPEDLSVVNGDLGELPDGIVTDLSQAIGRIARINLPVGRPLRADSLKANLVVHAGQNIKITSRGNGFSVTNEGVALNQGSAGEVIRVRLPGGQVVSGKAKAGGEVEIGF
jgi:flagella basal body P-ring formation protein FlgA